MSDISKKIFSIDPEPSEEPITQGQPVDQDNDLAIPEPESEDDIEAASDIADAENDASDDLDDANEPEEIAEDTPEDIEVEEDAPKETDISSLRPVVDIPDIIFRPIAEVVQPDDSDDEPNTGADAALEPSLAPITGNSLYGDLVPRAVSAPKEAPVYRASEPQLEPQTTRRLTWVGPVLGVFTALAIGSLAFAYLRDTPEVSALGLSGLTLAVIVPAIAVVVLSVALRTFSHNQGTADMLAEAADRLTHADRAVTQDIAHMSAAIRRELAVVDSQLAQSRAEMETLVAQITRQSADMDRITKTMADRSTATTQAMANHRDAFTQLIASIDEQMASLFGRLEDHKTSLNALTQSTRTDIGEATAALDKSTQNLSQSGEALGLSSEASQASIKAAEERLGQMLAQINQSTTELDTLFERRTAQLAALAEQLGADDGSTTSLLLDQTDRLSTIDKQIQSTDSQLAALLDQARSIQDQVAARLSDIDTSLTEANMRAKDFTADMADRVGDSVAQTRRELSIMEGELRALQSRMDRLQTEEAEIEPKEAASSGRLHLKPLETDFPSVALDDLSIPEEPEDRIGTIEPLDGPFEETAAASAQASTPGAAVDVIRRPGDAAPSKTVFGRAKSDKPEIAGWRWRDMLGTIDTANEPEATATPDKPLSAGIERPPAGVPLSAPPPELQAPEASDVVARLCEVELSPSGIVDAGTIDLASDARQSGGEGSQSSIVLSRLTPPILHLRGVLSADQDFRLRVEAFRQDYNHFLDTAVEPSQIRTKLGTAEGRAYLLCAASLMAS